MINIQLCSGSCSCPSRRFRFTSAAFHALLVPGSLRRSGSVLVENPRDEFVAELPRE